MNAIPVFRDLTPLGRAVLIGTLILMLGLSAVLLAVLSERLVGAIDPFIEQFGLTPFFVGVVVGQRMDLVFAPLEVAAVAAAAGIVALVSLDGESNWLEGALLLGVYVILGVSFFYLA